MAEDDDDPRSLGQMVTDAVTRAEEKRRADPNFSILMEIQQLQMSVDAIDGRWIERAHELNAAAFKRSDRIARSIHVLTWVVVIFGLIILFT